MIENLNVNTFNLANMCILTRSNEVSSLEQGTSFDSTQAPPYCCQKFLRLFQMVLMGCVLKDHYLLTRQLAVIELLRVKRGSR